MNINITIVSREELPHILNFLSLFGEGAEVGVKQGMFSLSLLSRWCGKMLYSIDPWQVFPDEEYSDVANVTQEQHDAFYNETKTRLSPFAERSNIIRETSQSASARFTDEQLDFVYLDAQHHYEAVVEDLELWCPKVKKGGILAGHDYLDGQRPEGLFGVKSAVDQFAAKNQFPLIASLESDWPSWFIFK